MNSFLLITIACCLLALPYSEAIKCYNCIATPSVSRSKNPYVPNWPFPVPSIDCGAYPQTTLVDCGPGSKVCHSIIIDINADGLENKQTLAFKTCGNEASAQACNTIGTRSASVKGSCYSCDTEGCNSAMSTALNIFTLVSAAAIFKLFH